VGGGAEAQANQVRANERAVFERANRQRRLHKAVPTAGAVQANYIDPCYAQDDKGMRSKPAKTVDEYLAGVPEPAQSTLRHIRALIRSVVPKQTTEVISYGIPMFKFNGMLVGYAAFKNHCSLFPTGSGVLDQFGKELKGYRTSKGTIQFPPDKPLPDGLIKKIVKARVKENKEWD
jgi:uncharacterized protein YdhG (YjbR/CyaY superfamily)